MIQRKVICIISPVFVIGLFYYIFNGENILLLLASSLIMQELLVRYVFFRSENSEYSRRLVSTNGVKKIRAAVGDKLLTPFILIGPALFGLLVLFSIWALFSHQFSLTGSILLVISVALLVDPVSTLFLEHSIGDAISASMGYAVIILIAMGSVPVVDSILSQIALVLALVNARFVFYDHFCLRNNIDLTFLAPGLLSLLMALLPNLNHFGEILGGR